MDFGHLPLHLVEPCHLLLDLHLLGGLRLLLVLDLLFGPPSLRRWLEHLISAALIDRNRLALHEELVDLGVHFHEFISLLLNLRVSRIDPLIDPSLELLAQPRVAAVDEVLPPKSGFLLLPVWETHLDKGIFLNQLKQILDC